MAKLTKTKGEINVVIARIGEEAKIYRVPSGSTVGEALALAGYNGGATDVRVDAKAVNQNTKVTANQVITIVPKVQGG